MKNLLLQILEDKKKGLVISHSQAIKVQSDWLRLFGTGGCDCYPYTTENDMFKDLCQHYNII